MTGPGSLRELKKRRNHDLIARNALELFARRGFERVTLAEIASAAEVGERTLFRYFPDKEELVFGEESAVEARLRAALADRPPREPPAAAAIQATLSLVELWQDRHAEGRVRAAVIAASPALRARERAKHAAHEGVLVDGLTARGVDEPTARLVARAAVAGLDEAIHRWLSEPHPTRSLLETARRTFAELVELLSSAAGIRA